MMSITGSQSSDATGKAEIDHLLVWKEVITPERARELLDRSPDYQRRLNKRHIQRLGTQMRRGEFRLNGETIILDSRGRLLNGRHRCMACLASGCSFPTLVVQNVEEDVFETIDSGRTRTAQDTIRMLGFANPTLVASIARIYWTQQRRLPTTALYRGEKPTNADLRSLCERLGPAFEVASHRARNIRFASVNPSFIGYMYFLCAQVDPDDAERFFDALARGVGLQEDDPIYILRRRLETWHAQRYNREDNLRILHMITHAWNAWRAGAPITRLRVEKYHRWPRIR